MKRKDFLLTLALSPLIARDMGLKELYKFSSGLSLTDPMPVLFLGHGSPMNAIEENEFVRGFRQLASELTRPRAILCVSAHWETRGTKVTAMPMPRTIHDFGGFPPALFEVQYPAPGSPELADATKAVISKTEVELDYQWGLDHGAWSVIKHLYPGADIPVIQLSLDYTQPARYHYELAGELNTLRSKGVLVIGSGNMVHNLGKVAWDKLNVPDFGFDWALEAREKMNSLILKGDHSSLINFEAQGSAFQLAIPSAEHYLPLLYCLALQQRNEEVALFNDKAVGGALTMTSLKIGK